MKFVIYMIIIIIMYKNTRDLSFEINCNLLQQNEHIVELIQLHDTCLRIKRLSKHIIHVYSKEISCQN